MATVTRFDQGNEIKIYYEVHGEGEPIVFHHGNGNCSTDWTSLGYTDLLKNNFQLIYIDLRGYGNSSKPHSPENYRLKARIEDTISVLDHLGVEKAHFLGISFAAAFCFLAARFYPERFKSYIFLTPAILFTLLENEELKSAMLQGADAYLEKLEEWFGHFDNPFLRKTFLANDGKALWASNSAEWFDYNNYIKYVNKPSLIYTGEKEPINSELESLANRLPDCQYVVAPGLDHASAHWRSDLVAPVITKFINDLEFNIKG